MLYNHIGIVNKVTGLIDYVGSCSKKQDITSLTKLLDELLNVGMKMYNEGEYETKENMRVETYKTFVSIARVADDALDKSSEKPARDLVTRIFSERGIDMGDYKTYEYAINDPKLN